MKLTQESDPTTTTAPEPTSQPAAKAKASKPKKPAKKPAAKKKSAAKKAKATKPSAGGRPKDGTVGAFIYDRVKAGDNNAAIIKAAVKKFDNDAIGRGSYVQWWRAKFIKTGAIKAPKGGK